MIFDEGFEWEEEVADGSADAPGAPTGGRDRVKRPDAAGFRASRALRLVPSRLLSRVWGKVNSIPIPKRARGAVYRSYSWAFGVNLEEIRSVGSSRLRVGVRGPRPADAGTESHCACSLSTRFAAMGRRGAVPASLARV